MWCMRTFPSDAALRSGSKLELPTLRVVACMFHDVEFKLEAVQLTTKLKAA